MGYGRWPATPQVAPGASGTRRPRLPVSHDRIDASLSYVTIRRLCCPELELNIAINVAADFAPIHYRRRWPALARHRAMRVYAYAGDSPPPGFSCGQPIVSGARDRRVGRADIPFARLLVAAHSTISPDETTHIRNAPLTLRSNAPSLVQRQKGFSRDGWEAPCHAANPAPRDVTGVIRRTLGRFAFMGTSRGTAEQTPTQYSHAPNRPMVNQIVCPQTEVRK